MNLEEFTRQENLIRTEYFTKIRNLELAYLEANGFHKGVPLRDKFLNQKALIESVGRTHISIFYPVTKLTRFVELRHVPKEYEVDNL